MNAATSIVAAVRRLPISAHETRRTFWVLSDQAVVSAGTFATGIVLARSLPPRDYGVYAFLMGILLTFITLQSAVIGYPLMVRGSVADESSFRRIVAAALLSNAGLALLVGAAVASGVHYLEGSVALSFAVGSALLAALMQQGTRSALLSRQQYHEALPGDIVSYVGQALIVWLIVRGIGSSLILIFAIIGATSLAGSCVQFARIGVRWSQVEFKWPAPTAFWKLGGWMVLVSVTGALTLQLFNWSLTFAHGPAEFAKFQAVVNVVGVTHPILLSLGNFITPAVAVANRARGKRFALSRALKRALPGTVLMVPLLLFLLVYSEWSLTTVYGEASPYAALTVVLRCFVIAYLSQHVSNILASFLNGIERPRATLFANLAGLLVAVLGGTPLTAVAGVNGAAAGIALAFITRALVASVLVIRTVRPRFSQKSSDYLGENATGSF